MGSLSQEVDAAAQDLEAAMAVVSNFHPDPEDDLAEFLSKFRHVSQWRHRLSLEASALRGQRHRIARASCKLRALACGRHRMALAACKERWRKHASTVIASCETSRTTRENERVLVTAQADSLARISCRPPSPRWP